MDDGNAMLADEGAEDLMKVEWETLAGCLELSSDIDGG